MNNVYFVELNNVLLAVFISRSHAERWARIEYGNVATVRAVNLDMKDTITITFNME